MHTWQPKYFKEFSKLLVDSTVTCASRDAVDDECSHLSVVSAFKTSLRVVDVSVHSLCEQDLAAKLDQTRPTTSFNSGQRS